MTKKEDFKTSSRIKEKLKEKLDKFLSPFKHFKEIYGNAKKVDKIFLILNFFFNGIFHFSKAQIEKGLFYIIVEIVFFAFSISCGSFYIGNVPDGFNWIIYVAYIFLILFLISYYNAFKSALFLEYCEQKRIYVKESYLISSTKEIIKSVKKYNREVAAVYREGKNISKFNLVISFFILGIAQFTEKQFIKGITYLLIDIGFITYMCLMGVNSIKDAINLNTYKGDHRAVLIYMILTVILMIFFVFIYITAQKSTLNKEIERNCGKILTFKSELAELSGPKAYIIYLILPIIGAIAFTVIPIIFMILIGFTNFGASSYGGLGQERFTWVGFDAFKNLFSFGDDFQSLASVFSWTMIWAFLATFTCYFGGFFLAILLNHKLVKIKPFWRSMFVIVMAIPQFVSLKVMNSLFQETGPINQMIMNGGGTAIRFWGNEYWAKFLIIVINMWVGIPYNMLLISGLLINVPQDNYEAAEIEGCTKWQVFKNITFPYVFFMTTPLLITSFVSNINNFNVIWLLVGGSYTVNSTDIMITWLYKLTIMQQRYDMGSVIGIIMFLISATISLIVFRRSSAYKNEEEFR